MVTIAWDIDDVLNNLMYEWLEKKWKADNKECRINYDELTSNPPHNILGISSEEYLKSLDEFRISEKFQGIKVVPEIEKWMIKFGDNYRHIVITAVPLNAAPSSAYWLINKLGRWIRTFHFIPSYRRDRNLPVYDSSKQRYLKWLNKADLFIDDNENNLDGLDKINTKGFLFPRPWNNSKQSIEEMLENCNEYIDKIKMNKKRNLSNDKSF